MLQSTNLFLNVLTIKASTDVIVSSSSVRHKPARYKNESLEANCVNRLPEIPAYLWPGLPLFQYVVILICIYTYKERNI